MHLFMKGALLWILSLLCIERYQVLPAHVQGGFVAKVPPLRVNLHPYSFQAHLRTFIPLMLKYATGRGKPGWGKLQWRPPWWPSDVPWANVRSDERPPEVKTKVNGIRLICTLRCFTRPSYVLSSPRCWNTQRAAVSLDGARQSVGPCGGPVIYPGPMSGAMSVLRRRKRRYLLLLPAHHSFNSYPIIPSLSSSAMLSSLD